MWADIEGWWGDRDAAGGPWHCSVLVGGGLWAWGAGFEGWWDKARCAKAAAPSPKKVVAAASVTVGGRRAGQCCCRVCNGWNRRL